MLPRSLVEAYTWPMRDQIEIVGWGLIACGLSWVLLVVLTAVSRSDDAPWQAFAWLYGFTWVMVFVGFQLLRYVGAWPAPHANRS